jgi:hypothetical protein
MRPESKMGDAVNKTKEIIREPLVHFLLIGAGLFLLFNFTNGPAGDKSNRIVVTPGQVEQMTARFTRSRMRPPTKQEMTGLIEDHLRDEIYYREAIAMGLDKNDGLVRRRMRQKLEFILEDISAQADPTDEVLTDFMQKHMNRYRLETQISFQQVYLSPDRRKDMTGDTRKMLARLRAGTDPKTLGDPIMVGHEFYFAYESEIKRAFGEVFARQILKLEPGDWAGPVISGLGGHLVLVSERRDGRMPELAEVRTVVERDWLAQRRKELKDLTFRKLLEGYEVVMEPPSKPGDASDTAVAATPAEEGTR